MRTRLALLLSTAAIASLPVVLPVPAGADGATPVAHVACSKITVHGETRCIAAGQFCRRDRAWERAYRKKGLTCAKRDRNGRYHLTYR